MGGVRSGASTGADVAEYHSLRRACGVCEFNALGAPPCHLVINLTSAQVAGLVVSFGLPHIVAYGVIAALIATAVARAARPVPPGFGVGQGRSEHGFRGHPDFH
jgi:hypothetical protein